MNPLAATTGVSSTVKRRLDMANDELTTETVQVSTSLTLMRERERDLYATFASINRCITDSAADQFTHETGEGGGDTGTRVSRLNEFIKRMVLEVEDARTSINSDAPSKQWWKNSNKVGAFSSGACVKYRG